MFNCSLCCLLFNCSGIELKWWFLSVIALSSQLSKNLPQDVLQTGRKFNSAEFDFSAKLSGRAGFILPDPLSTKAFPHAALLSSYKVGWLEHTRAGEADPCLLWMCVNEPSKVSKLVGNY